MRNCALLDLVFSSEPDMIDSTCISVLSKLGKSDHNMLEWEVQLSPVFSVFNKPCLNYREANFTAIRQALRETHWSVLLRGDANEQ